ncbi:MAG: glycosyltransferase family 2 protein, partial [Acetobacteraceae bacterium]
RVDLFDASDFPLTINTSAEQELLQPRRNFTIGPILGANMMFKREVLKAIGGFDPDFGPGTPFVCDDIDAVARASLAGYWGLYTPDVAVSHHHGRKADEARALRRTYAIAVGAYRMKLLLTSGAGFAFWKSSYRTVARFLEGRVGPGSLVLQVQGAARYAALRLRRRIVRAVHTVSHP